MRIIQRLLLQALVAIVTKLGLVLYGIDLTWPQAITLVFIVQAFAYLVRDDEKQPTVVIIRETDEGEGEE